jgi:hypothetical protein
MSLAVLGLFRLFSPVFKPTRHFLPPQALRATEPAMAAPASAPIAAKRLRITRIIEASGSRHTAGRMFISGSMQEVCAELDRLVALESAATHRKS